MSPHVYNNIPGYSKTPKIYCLYFATFFYFLLHYLFAHFFVCHVILYLLIQWQKLMVFATFQGKASKYS